MISYRTGEIAKMTGIHENTVRFYENIGFISKPERMENGYRIFTELHLKQIKLARIAMRAEILQNGLRKKAVQIVNLCAGQDVENAIISAKEYSKMIDNEILRAQNAICAVENILKTSDSYPAILLKRKHAAEKLGVTVDTLRNWELNGLIQIKRKSNGYRVYNEDDMEKLTIIRTLRCANYSLSAILRLMTALSSDENISVSQTLNTPKADEEIISVCDRLLIALTQTKQDSQEILIELENIKEQPYM